MNEGEYVRLRKDSFKELRFTLLSANSDDYAIGQFIDLPISYSVAGFCKWVSDTRPVIAIDFCWYINNKNGRLVIVRGSTRSNMMLISASGRSYGRSRTLRFLVAWLSVFLNPVAVKDVDLPADHGPKTSVKLTDGEVDILRWAAEGKTSWEIAKIVDLSERTVKFRRDRLIQKMGAVNMVQAAVTAFALGIIN